jgi:hypothetical protein
MLERDKNWSPFEHKGTLYWSYKLSPHVVCTNDIDISTLARNDAVDCVLCQRSHASSSTGIIDRLEQSLKLRVQHRLMNRQIEINSEFHLNGVPAFFIPGTGSYLGIGHVVVRCRGFMDYFHVLYKFEAEPPFRLTAVSAILNLEKSKSNAVRNACANRPNFFDQSIND